MVQNIQFFKSLLCEVDLCNVYKLFSFIWAVFLHYLPLQLILFIMKSSLYLLCDSFASKYLHNMTFSSLIVVALSLNIQAVSVLNPDSTLNQLELSWMPVVIGHIGWLHNSIRISLTGRQCDHIHSESCGF